MLEKEGKSKIQVCSIICIFTDYFCRGGVLLIPQGRRLMEIPEKATTVTQTLDLLFTRQALKHATPQQQCCETRSGCGMLCKQGGSSRE